MDPGAAGRGLKADNAIADECHGLLRSLASQNGLDLDVATAELVRRVREAG